MRNPTLTTLALATALATGSFGCGAPPVDDFRGEGGTAPDPTGVIEGTVLYQGPRPMCDRDEAGVATQIRGRVIMTLFLFDNPPPPSGSATSAANLLTIPAPLLFSSLDDCMPEEGSTEILTRSVSFTWPELPLGQDYQIRGFYDYDEDFNPFFNVSNLPTAGDIAGGALVNPAAPQLGFRRIEFGTAEDNPNGQVVPGVAVGLGAPVRTERPVFTFSGMPMSAQETLPLIGDQAEAERRLYALANAKLNLYSRDQADPQTAALVQAMSEGALSIDTSDVVAYAWYVGPVDGNGDGAQDLHPILGRTAMIPWYFPITIMRRVQSALELQARIPSSTLIPSVRPLDVAAKIVHYPDIDITIPPIAVMQTFPDARCQFPIIPPGNTADRLEGGGMVNVECAELPTGYYGINVLQGFAGGRVVGGGTTPCDPDDPERTVEQQCGAGAQCISNRCTVISALSETGFGISGAQFSSQAWTIPNPLGDPMQIASPVPEQGNSALYVVFDEDPSNAMGRVSGREECISTRTSIAVEAPKTVEYTDFRNFGDEADEVRELCCAPVRHLCGLPLCDMVPASEAPDAPQIRSSPTTVDGVIPNCIPFEMPAFCCTE